MENIQIPITDDVCLYVYTLEPFKAIWVNDCVLRQELVGENNTDKIVENDESIISQTTPTHSYDKICDELKAFFNNNPNGKWKKVLNLKKQSGKICPFLTTSVPYEKDNNGKVESIIVRLEEIPNGDRDIQQIQHISNQYFRKLYEGQLNKLSETEYDVFVELVKGKSVTQIAEETYRSKHTIESHSATIKKKLDCKDIYELMQLGYQIGVISTPRLAEFSY